MADNEQRNAEVVLTANTDQFSKEIDKGNKSLDKLLTTLDKTSKAWDGLVKKTGKGLVKLGTAELAGYAALSLIAGKLEKQTENIQANMAINKASGQFNMVTDSIREMSRTMPLARAEVAAMATEVSNLGFVTGEQIAKVTSNFSKMGIATGEPSAQLASSMVQFQRSMGLTPSAQTMKPYQDSVTYLSARAGTPATGILNFAQTVAPAARVAGLSQSSVLGLATAATRAGADGAYASNTINAILNDITALRYSRSPEIRRYSGALNMPVSELTRQTNGEADQDAFMRDIMSRVVAVAQSAEGPTKLSTLGFDGLRAQRALQSIASEAGGIDRWIKEARYGMGSNAVETGFTAASDGLFDEMEMFRNKLTDIGQVIGEPLANIAGGGLGVLNDVAEAAQPIIQAFSELASVLMPVVGALKQVGGIALQGWSLFATAALVKRLSKNVVTESIRGSLSGVGDNFQLGRVIGRGVGLGEATGKEFRQAAPKGLLSQIPYYMGGVYGGTLPNLRPDSATGRPHPLQAMYKGLDKAMWWLSDEAIFNYKQAKENDPQERVKNAADRRDLGRDKYERQRGRTGAYGIGEVGQRAATSLVRVPAAGLGFAADMAWQGTKWGVTQGVPKALGGMAAGIGSLGSMAAGAIGPANLAIMAAAGTGLFMANKWGQMQESKDKWDPKKGKGIGDDLIDNMAKYNESVGVATRSLVRFANVLDSTNPAQSEDLAWEIAQNKNVRDVGREPGYEMINPDLRKIEGVQSIKEWLAAQGTIGADPGVNIFRDIASMTNNNEYEDIQKWYTNYLNGGGINGEQLGTGSLIQNYALRAKGERSIGETALSSLGWLATGQFLGVDYSPDWMTTGMRGKLTDDAGSLMGSNLSLAKEYAEKKDISGIITGNEKTEDKQAALKLATNVSLQTRALDDLLVMIDETQSPTARNALMAGYKELVAAIGKEAFGNKDLSSIQNLPGSGISVEKQKEEINRAIYEAFKNDTGADAMLANQYKLLTPQGAFGGISAEDFLGRLPQTSTPTTIESFLSQSKFAGKFTDTEKEKYFGSKTLLGTALTTGVSDPAEILASSFQLLTVSSDKLNGTVSQTDSALQSMKTGLEATSPQFQVITQAQAFLQQTQGDWKERFGTYETREAYREERTNQLYDDYMADPNRRTSETGTRLKAQYDALLESKQQEDQMLREYRRSRQREQADWDRSTAYQKEVFDTQQENATTDFYHGQKMAADAFHRSMANSEATFYRSLKYQQQDFYRSRKREAEDHARQMTYVAEDMAKSIGDPYNRIQLQLLNDPNAMISNMENRLSLVTAQNRNVAALKERGLSNEAVQQLDLTNFNNAQQTQHLANTMSDADIAEFNRIAKAMVSQSGELNKSDPGTIRQEKERSLSLARSLEDFLRGLKRTKIEHAIQVKFSKKEFEIQMTDSEKQFKLSLERAREAYDKSIEQAEIARKNQFERDMEDMYGIYSDTADTMAGTAKESIKTLEEYGGTMAAGLVDKYKKVTRQVEKLTKAYLELNLAQGSGPVTITSPSNPQENNDGVPRGRGAAVARAGADKTNIPGMCLHEVSRWLAPGGIRGASSATDAWNKSKKKHVGSTSVPPGYPVYWGGGDGHVALSIGGGWVRSTDWPKRGHVGSVKISELTKAWGKPYYGWAEDAWGHKLAAGGVAKAIPGGVKATIAEAGSNELVMPLDRRGLTFMKDFQVSLAHELVRAMPKTPTGGGVTNNITNRNQNIDIKTVEVKTNDPKEFARHLQAEAQKKRAALYKS